MANNPFSMPTIKSGGGNNNNRKKNRNNNNNGNNKKRRRNNNNGGNGVVDPISGAPGPKNKNNPYGSQYANPDLSGFASWLVHQFYQSSPDIRGLDLQNDGQGPMRYSVF